MGSRPVKKGRHRRFEEARALKRSTEFDADRLFESLKKETPPGYEPGQESDEDEAFDDDEDDED